MSAIEIQHVDHQFLPLPYNASKCNLLKMQLCCGLETDLNQVFTIYKQAALFQQQQQSEVYRKRRV